MKALARLMLRRPLFRKAFLDETRDGYFNYFKMSLEIGDGLAAPLCHPDATASLSEVFFLNAYGVLNERMDLPDSWLDVGCHYGFFSLWLLQQHKRRGTLERAHSVLVDADARSRIAIERLRHVNHLEEAQCRFIHGAVATEANPLFMQRQGMGSSLQRISKAQFSRSYKVQRLDEQRILDLFPDGMDLIKLDVEAAEFIFIEHYVRILGRARHLLLEWHSWAQGWQGVADLTARLENRGFAHVGSMGEERIVSVDGVPGSCGTELYQQAAKT